MAILFGLIVLIGCMVLFYISENQAGKALEAEAGETMLKVAKQAAETKNSRLQARIYLVESLANRNVIRGIQGDREATMDEKLKALQDEQKRAESWGFKRFDIIDKAGNAVYPDGSTANLAEREYFKAALSGKTFYSSTIVSKVDNSVVFVISTPIRHYATDEITGVLIGVVDALKFSELVEDIIYGRTGYALAVDGAGKTIAYKDVEKVKEQQNFIEEAKSDQSLAPLIAIISKMANGEEGIGTYTYQGIKKIIAYAPIKTTGWSIGVIAPRAEALARAAGLRKSILFASILIIFAALVLTFAIARSIATPIALSVNHLGLIAEGDFTMPVPDKFLRAKDEIGKLANAIHKLQANLRPLLSGLRDDAKILSSNSEVLSATSEEIASSSGEVANAIQQVASGASDQASNLQEILGLIEKITTSLEKVYNELGRVKASSEETSRLAGVGKKELDVLIASIKGVRKAFKIVTEKLSNLSGSVNQISQILEVINGIADQTTLLALNVAIEAARAGEAGRGFAVVADEVRKLAEQSRASSDKIKVLLNTIGSETKEVVNTSDEVNKQVVAQLENVENTVKSFDNILDSVAAIAPMIEATYREVDSTVKAKDVVLDRVQTISSVSEETSASAEEISASAQELSASTQEIASNAQQVMEVAKRLEEQVERFKV